MSWVLTLCSNCLSLPPSGSGVPYFVSIVAVTSAGEGEPNEKIFFTEERGEGIQIKLCVNVILLFF